VDLEVSSAVLTRTGDILCGDALATFGGLAGDHQERLQLVRDCRVLQVRLHLNDEVLVAVEMVRGNRAMNRLAIPAVVLRRDDGRNQLALAWRERVRSVQQDVGELVERFRGLWPERHRSPDSGDTLGQRDVRHQYLAE
jgi:hypothetical protein